jgi:membrane fusion protein (multidrug efflux system)
MTRSQPPSDNSQNNSRNGRNSATLEHDFSSSEGRADAATNSPTRSPEAPESDDLDNGSDNGSDTNGKASSPLKKMPKRRKRLLFVGIGIGAVVAAIFGLRWWHYASTHEDTNDAYVQGHVHPISSRIDGTVSAVFVNDNQHVTAGQVLVKLDPKDYQNQVNQAQAALLEAKRQAETAKTQIALSAQTTQGSTTQAQGNIANANAAIANAQAAVKEAQAGIPAAQAQVAQAQANLQKNKADYQRYRQLYQAGAVSQQQFDAAKNAYQVALAQRNAAQEQVTQARAKLTQAQQNVASAQAQLRSSQGGLQQAQAGQTQTQVNRNQYQTALAALAQAQAKLKNAQLQLSYTTIAAPTAGVVGNKTVEVGQRVQPGNPLMAVVSDDIWVTANFKETQLEDMHPGQPVQVTLDAFPHHPFNGHVDSFAPASGAQFALLPPDNATGNFTKVVQRIPVKIILDPQSVHGYESRISPGMSAVVSVDVE